MCKYFEPSEVAAADLLAHGFLRCAFAECEEGHSMGFCFLQEVGILVCMATPLAAAAVVRAWLCCFFGLSHSVRSRWLVLKPSDMKGEEKRYRSSASFSRKAQVVKW